MAPKETEYFYSYWKNKKHSYEVFIIPYTFTVNFMYSLDIYPCCNLYYVTEDCGTLNQELGNNNLASTK